MEKLVMVSVKRCYRTVRRHPFLLGFVCFLFFLYRSFPLLFSLLVSASPVLVCTAVLLGTLLSFGQPNIPEIEKEENVTHHDIASLKSEALGDSTVVVNRDSTVEMFIGSKRGMIEDELGMIGYDDQVLESNPLISDISSEPQCEKQYDNPDIMEKSKDIDEDEKFGHVDDVICGGDVGELLYSLLEETGVENTVDISKGVTVDNGVINSREVGGHLYSLIQEEDEDDADLANGEVESEFVDSRVGSSKGSTGKVVDDGDDDDDDDDYEEEEEEEEDEDDESSDFGSDRAESSSPDASMADILPLLDELHPLLHGEEAPNSPKHVHISHDGSDVASDHSHQSENGIIESDHDSKEDDDGDGDGDGDDDEDQEEEEEEEDQEGKEDESKSAITWTEDDQKNLMDLGTSEIERNKRLENLIARRRARQTLRLMAEKNLIDLDGSDSDLPFNVPPISTARRNPFDGSDNSYSSLGLPPIPGSAPSVLLQRRNPFDLPYDLNEEKPDLKGGDFQQEFVVFQPKEGLFRRYESFRVGPSKWRPYFVPEHLTLEGTCYSSFERQLSGVSEKSKASSVPDTESVNSTVDHDDKRVVEGEEYLQETEEMANMDRVSLFVKHRSHSSVDFEDRDIEEDEGRKVDHDEGEIILGDAALITDAIEEENNSRSSSSVFSEVNERIDAVKKEEEGLSSPRDNDLSEEPNFEKELEFSFMNDQHREPVYDSSPSAFEKHLSFSSDSSGDSLEDDALVKTDSEIIEVDTSQARSFESEEFSGDLRNVSFLAETAMEHDGLMGGEDLLKNSVKEVIVSQAEMQQHFMVVENVSLASPSILSHSTEHVENHAMDVEQHEQDQMDAPDSSHIHSLYDASLEPSDSLFPGESSKEPESSSDEADPILDSRDRIQSSTSDTLMDVGITQDLDLNVVSSISFDTSDGYMIQPNVEREACIILTDSTEQINGAEGSSNAEEIHDDEGKESVAVSTLTSKSSSVSSESSDSDTPMTRFDLRDHLLAKLEFGGFAHQIENYDHSREAFESRVVYETTNEEADDAMREINEVFLSELDAVGDFRVTESEEIQESHSEGEARSLDDFHIEDRNFEETHEEKETSVAFKSAESSSEAIESRLDLHEPEDSDTAESKDQILEETHEEEETSVAVKSAESSSEAIESRLELDDPNDSDTAEISSKLPVLEVKSTEDITMAFMQLNEGADLKEVILPSSIAELNASESRSELNKLKDSDTAECSSKLPFLEVKSTEDITMAFMQLNEGADLEEVILPNSITEPNASGAEKSSSLHAVEARSLDDIHDIMKRVSEDTREDPPGEDEAHLEDSDTAESSLKLPVLEVRSVEDITMAFMQLNEGADLEEVILPSSITNPDVSGEGSSSSLHAVEARSLDDIRDIMIRGVSEVSREEEVSEVPRDFQSDVQEIMLESHDVQEIMAESHEVVAREISTEEDEVERNLDVDDSTEIVVARTIEYDVREIIEVSHEVPEDSPKETEPEDKVVSTDEAVLMNLEYDVREITTLSHEELNDVSNETIEDTRKDLPEEAEFDNRADGVEETRELHSTEVSDVREITTVAHEEPQDVFDGTSEGGGTREDLTEEAESKERSDEVEQTRVADEVESTEVVVPRNLESYAQEITTVSSEVPGHVSDGTTETPNPDESGSRNKKLLSRSSSSSSSSSTDSD